MTSKAICYIKSICYNNVNIFGKFLNKVPLGIPFGPNVRLAMQGWTLCLSVGPYIALFPSHLRGEEDGPGVLEEDEEVAGLVGGREERDEVGHAQQRDDDEERLGRLQVLVVLRLGVVGPQLATHHLRQKKRMVY